MHTEPVKTAKEMALNGVTVEFVTEGKTLLSVVLRSNGNAYAIKKEYYGEYIKVVRLMPHREEEQFVVSGDLDGFEVSKSFETASEALAFLRNINREHGLTITKAMVKIDAGGSPSESNAVPF